jgi:hypothetical protein
LVIFSSYITYFSIIAKLINYVETKVLNSGEAQNATKEFKKIL